nr:hypothetical protein GCM10017745_15500 [Saccharothrix mutabilis subsp. capreolus]
MRWDVFCPSNNRPWFDVSATECTASASIDDDPVIRKPTNFANAIPALATNAAMIALVPPPADTVAPSPKTSGLPVSV